MNTEIAERNKDRKRMSPSITGLVTLQRGRFVTAGADGLVKCWTLGLTLAYAGYNPNLFFAKSLPWAGRNSTQFKLLLSGGRPQTLHSAHSSNDQRVD